jgi:transcriptional regulator with XRE-family HTH domain
MRKKKEIKLKLIAERIVAVRKLLKLSQKDVGDQLGVTSVSVYQAERQYSTLLFEILILFANMYNINPAWVLIEDNARIPQMVDRSGPSDAPGPVHAENLTADQLAARMRRDVLKLKELAEEEAIRKAKTQKGKK